MNGNKFINIRSFKIYSKVLLVFYIIIFLLIFEDSDNYLMVNIFSFAYLMGFSLYLYILFAVIKKSFNEEFIIFKKSYLVTNILMAIGLVMVIFNFHFPFFDILIFVSLISFVIHFVQIIIEIQKFLADKSIFYYMTLFVFFPFSLSSAFKIMRLVEDKKVVE
jgi:hypothetical protein